MLGTSACVSVDDMISQGSALCYFTNEAKVAILNNHEGRSQKDLGVLDLWAFPFMLGLFYAFLDFYHRDKFTWRIEPGVTGQNIPPAGIYPGLKRPRLDYTRVYYGLGQFIPAQAKIYPHDINHDINSDERYTHELFNFSTSY